MIAFIRSLPIGNLLALKLYNRALKVIAPRKRAITKFGASMDCDRKDFIQATIALFGHWEPEVSAVLSQLTKVGDTVVDIGANVGYYSLLLADKVGSSGCVFAIEAHPEFAQAVRENAALNRASSIEVINVAVTAKVGEVNLYVAPKANGGASTTLASRGFGDAIKVLGRPLLAILGKKARQVSLIKIDIEGAEIPVLKEILANLNKFSRRLAIVVEADTHPEWPTLFQSFIAAGFTAYSIRNEYDWRWYLEECFGSPVPIDSLPNEPSDLLFLRSSVNV
jgi:FkbM family methyltransferase